MSTVSPAALRAPASRPPIRFARSSDELLARHAARGSERAFAALYERYHQALYRYCRSIVRNDADAQDALQSTFAGALAALRRDARNAPLRPWLYRIAHNESISLLRRRKRDTQQEIVPEPTASAASAEEQAAGRARWRRLVADLAELPERQRGALLLRELSGLSHEEIALALGMTVGAAKQAIFEARQGLAEVEEGRAMSCDEVCRRVSEGDRRVLRGRRVRAHLRECAACESFALAIPARQAELRAFTPLLPSAAAAALLRGAIRGASSHAGATAGGASVGGASGTAGGGAGAAAAAKAAGTAVAWKALATAAVVVTAAAGTTGLVHALRHHHATRPLVGRRAALATGHAATHAPTRSRTVAPAVAKTPVHPNLRRARTGATRHGAHHHARAAVVTGTPVSHQGASQHTAASSSVGAAKSGSDSAQSGSGGSPTYPVHHSHSDGSSLGNPVSHGHNGHAYGHNHVSSPSNGHSHHSTPSSHHSTPTGGSHVHTPKVSQSGGGQTGQQTLPQPSHGHQHK